MAVWHSSAVGCPLFMLGWVWASALSWRNRRKMQTNQFTNAVTYIIERYTKDIFPTTCTYRLCSVDINIDSYMYMYICIYIHTYIYIYICIHVDNSIYMLIMTWIYTQYNALTIKHVCIYQTEKYAYTSVYCMIRKTKSGTVRLIF